MRNRTRTSHLESLEPRRLFATGGLDTNFGDGGKVASDIRVEQGDDVLLGIQPDGGIIAVGIGVVARFTAAGQLDRKFGLAGKVADPALDSPEMMALQPDGKALVGAYMTIDADPPPGENGSLFLITRYQTNGKIDKTFGHRGRVVIDNPARGQLAVQPDGKILYAAGTLRRLLPDGSPDPTFGGGDGTADCPAAFTGSHFGLTADEKIVVVGTTRTERAGFEPENPFPVSYFTNDTTIVRLEPDGTLDA